MQFVVRYWSSLLSREFREADGSPRLVDYSTHPPSKLGLHSALLSHHDRMEILEAHGGSYQCEVFVVEDSADQVLSQELALSLFNALPNGEVRWTDIREFLLPQDRKAPRPPIAEGSSHERQLQLFEYAHTPDDDSAIPHQLDIDA